MRLCKNSAIGIMQMFIVVALLISQSFIFSEVNNPSPASPPVNNKDKILTETHTLQINPFGLYSKEPAPMGISDFGINGNGVPYKYYTSSFMGRAYVYNMSVFNRSINGSQAWASFQLNVNLVFNNSNSSYVYWVQNVAQLNSSNNYISFVDNIWNFSSPDAKLNNNSVTGNGTVTTAGNLSFYYSFANQYLPGNNITLKEPFNIELRVISGNNSNGVPEVVFQYNDGYGWVSYDAASFIFAKHLSSMPLFLVDGYRYEPTGYTLYDAEMIIGGPGNGSSTNDINSRIYMSLFFWNGHNYQAISNAYNFGSNTAETLSNAATYLSYSVSNGQIYSELISGTGKLGLLYQQSQMSIVNIRTSTPSGTLFVNDSKYNFENYEINVTLYPNSNIIQKGYYHFILENSNHKIIWQRNISLSAGQYLSLEADIYNIKFNEEGIPNGTLWSIHLSNGENYFSTNSSIIMDLPNGSYYFYIYIENGTDSVSNGSFTVFGKNLTFFVEIKVRYYAVYFKGSGLPQGVSWSININGQEYKSRNNTFQILLPNGTYKYSIAPLQGFRIYPESGLFNVNNSSITIGINWSVITYRITIKIIGLQNGEVWSLLLTGKNFLGTSVNNKIKFNSSITYIYEPNGSYEFFISVPPAYYLPHSSGRIYINGTNISLTLASEKNEFIFYLNQMLKTQNILFIGIAIIALVFIIASVMKKKRKL